MSRRDRNLNLSPLIWLVVVILILYLPRSADSSCIALTLNFLLSRW